MAENTCHEEVVTPDCELKNKLSGHAVSFINVFEGNRVKMDQTVHECQRIYHEVVFLHDTRPLCKLLGILVGVLVLHSLIVSMINTSAVNVIVAIVPAFIFVGICWFYVKQQTKEKQFVETVEKLMKDFRETVTLLKTKLEKVKWLCEELRGDSCGSDKTNLMKVEVTILELFLFTDSLRETVTADCVKEVYYQFERTFTEFESISSSLKCFTRNP